MGVFIKGMEMPKVCAECFMDPPCCKALSGDINIWKERHPDCPLVEVKEPHGRLIDADKLLVEHGLKLTEEFAPTIIDAEVSEI